MIYLVCQLIGLIPIYRSYKKDCEKYGENNLAVPLDQRIMAYLVAVPFWMVPLLASK